MKHARLPVPESPDSAQYLPSRPGRRDAALHRHAKNDKSLRKAMEMLRFTRCGRQRAAMRGPSGPGLSGGLPGEPECVLSCRIWMQRCVGLVLKGNVQKRCCPFRQRVARLSLLMFKVLLGFPAGQRTSARLKPRESTRTSLVTARNQRRCPCPAVTVVGRRGNSFHTCSSIRRQRENLHRLTDQRVVQRTPRGSPTQTQTA